MTFLKASGLTPLNIAIFAVVFAIFWWTPGLFRKIAKTAHRSLGLLERHPALTVVLVALMPIVFRIALLPTHPMPVPRIHDEFSYLLAADTFAHGRVTNPPHPLYQFFETYHVLPHPTYMSKYPPVQGLLLAAGQVLFGNPWLGVMLSIALMTGSLCWMLQGWLPGRWALLGSAAVALQFGVGSYWMNSYWGGAPAAIGAAILLGAFARLRRYRPFASHPIRNSLLFALGAVILLNSRPWEGVAIIAPTGIALLFWTTKADFFERVRTVLIPAAALLAVAAMAMLFYNWRGTGHVLQMPYKLVHQTYSVTPLFVWEKRTPDPQYNHAIMKRFYLEVEPRYQAADTLHTLSGWLAVEPGRLRMTKDILFGNFFLLLCLPLLFRPSPSLRLPLALLAIFLVALALECWNQTHYFGPVLGLAGVLKMTSLRRLSTLRFHQRRIGIALTTAVILCSAVALAQAALVFPNQDAFSHQRAALLKELEAKPGSHVVLVRYSAGHSTTQEWVYNHADIDASKVVWAREMSDQENRKLFDYFKGRTFWLIEPDAPAPRLTPLSAAVQQGALWP